MRSKSSNSIYRLSAIGLMTAFAFVSNYFSIQLGDVARIHFGNIFCVLSGLLLGPIGGLCAGLGAFFYDLTNPLYSSEAWLTFILKFFIGFLAGIISHTKEIHGENHVRNIIGSIVGSVTYVFLYLAKSFIKERYFLGSPMGTVWSKLAIKAPTSLLNAIIAVVFALILCPIFIRAMKSAHIWEKLYPPKES